MKYGAADDLVSTLDPTTSTFNFAQVLSECERCGGEGSKKAIQAALSKLDETGRKLMWYMMNPYLTFGVKKYDRPLNYSDCDNAIEPFFEILDELASRKLTGNLARATVEKALGMFTKETANYLERVIEQDPRAGFSTETYNYVLLAEALNTDVDTVKKRMKKEGIEKFRALPVWEKLVPSFDQQLAEKCESEEEFEQYVQFPCQADIKYDGTRAFAFVKAGMPVDYRARGGKPSEHLNGLFDEELQQIREAYGQDFVLDGETLASTFEETMNAKGSKNADAKKNLVFRAFFIMPLSDWIAQKTTITNRESRETLTKLLANLTKIKLTEGRVVQDYADMVAYCNEVIDDETKMKTEREGLILKSEDAVYEWGRSYTWVKVKRFYDVDARIVGFYKGRAKTRLEHTIGGVNCIAFLENGTKVVFNVGSGFSDEHRADMLANPEKWLAGTHVITYQEVSKSKGKEDASLRFCTYSHTRDDKLVEI